MNVQQVDRRRVADQEKSREKALAARKEKGLLTKADEVSAPLSFPGGRRTEQLP